MWCALFDCRAAAHQLYITHLRVGYTAQVDGRMAHSQISMALQHEQERSTALELQLESVSEQLLQARHSTGQSHKLAEDPC
jgi:hypothetical protein